jgi:hypothetical protein
MLKTIASSENLVAFFASGVVEVVGQQKHQNKN